MQITDLIILMLVVIDVVSLSMVTFIFRWARKAMENFRTQIMDLLSGENEESVAIIEKLGHTIYQKLYRYFNLKIPDSEPMGNLPDNNVVQNLASQYLGSSPAPSVNPLMAEAASKMGIPSDALKYLPLLQKFLGRNSKSEENINTGNDYW
jgi:hypothetical protein